MSFQLKLEKLELGNYRSFKNCTVDFDPQMTVLVGNNGAGKSSVLSAIAVGLSDFLAAFGTSQQAIKSSDACTMSCHVNGVVDRHGIFPITISTTCFMGEDEGARLRQWTSVLAAAEEEGRNAFDQNLFDYANELYKRVMAGDQSLVLPLIAFYGTDRLWNKTAKSVEARRKQFNRLDGYNGALEARADQEQMLTWFFKMTAQDLQRAQSIAPTGESPIFLAVRNAIASCFKSITGSDRVNVTYNLDMDDLDIEYIDSSCNVQRTALSQLSDGYRSTLSLIADIAYRMALLNPSLGEDILETPGIVLVDEVELHLHPVWQARILGDLRSIFPNIQFVVTTHAPAVISSVRSQQVRIIADGEKALTPAIEIYGSDAGRVLTSIMNVPERPVEIQAKFDAIYDLLDSGNYDAAQKAIDDLAKLTGNDDTDLIGARTALSLEKAGDLYVAN